MLIHQCGFDLPGNTLATVKTSHRKYDGKIQSGHFRLFVSWLQWQYKELALTYGAEFSDCGKQVCKGSDD